MSPKKVIFLIAVFTTSPAFAEGLQINGFASTGVGVVDEDVTYWNGEGERPNFNAFNKLGLNLVSEIGSDVTFSGQVLAKGIGGNYVTKADWILFNYQPFNFLQFRIGRQRLPIWLLAEVIDVSFAYPWVVPPTAVYSRNPIKSFNGASIAFAVPLGNSVDIRFEPFAGRLNEKFVSNAPDGGTVESTIDADKIYGALLQAEVFQAVLLHAFYLDSEFNSESPIYRTENIRIQQWSFGLKVDYQNFLFMAEMGRGAEDKKDDTNEILAEAAATQAQAEESGSPEDIAAAAEAAKRAAGTFTTFAEGTAYYATLGYRYGVFMPHATYSVVDVSDSNALGYSQQSYIVGLRTWVEDQVSFKAEWEAVSADEGTGGLALERDTDIDEYNVYRFAVDAVF